MNRKPTSSDERGAIMLIAVFIAIFAVGLLYYLIGISATVLFREKVQDAADAAVLSSAIMHARAMNLIVLINIIMAAILSVLVTVKLIETLAIVGTGLAAGLACVTAGASLVAIPPLNTVRSSMQTAYEDLRDPIFDALSALHDVADAVRDATPGAALMLAEANLEANPGSPNTHGVVFGTRMELPVEDDSFSELCGRAAKLPTTLAKESLSAIPPLSAILGALESPMQTLGSSLSEWFCGDGTGTPPSYQQTIERLYPRTDMVKACEDDHSTGSLADASRATNSDCDQSQSDEDAAKPDPTTGNCQASHDCSLGGPYETHVRMAREQCEPSCLNLTAPYVYYYQTRRAVVVYTWNGKLWVRGKPDYQTPDYKSSDSPPCGPQALHPVIATGYNMTVHKNDAVTEVEPVCSSEAPPSPLQPQGRADTTTPVQFTEVLQILGCKRRETKNIDLSDASRAGSAGSDKAPKKVQQKDGDGNEINLGNENFQIRAILNSKVPSGLPERMMGLTLWNHAAPENPLSVLRPLGNFSLAEAEFFYDARDARSEWMWNMNWRARLRRFRVPTGRAMNMVEEFCDKLPAGCGPILDQIKRLGTLIVH
jgi:hypothetical protein